jgi:hypothetical protein
MRATKLAAGGLGLLLEPFVFHDALRQPDELHPVAAELTGQGK